MSSNNMSGQMKNIHRTTIDAGDLLNYANIPSYFEYFISLNKLILRLWKATIQLFESNSMLWKTMKTLIFLEISNIEIEDSA